jgi:hypothetical protein
MLDNWLWALVLGGAWGYIAVMNARCAWRHYVRKQADGPKVLPIAGAACAFLGLLALPVGHANERLNLLWPFLVLDVGSLPFFVVGAVVLLVRAIRDPRAAMRALTDVPTPEEREKAREDVE